MEPTTIVVKAAEQLRSAIEQVERILTVLDFDEDAAYATLALGIDDCLAELSALGIWGEQNRLVSSLLWNVCQPSLSRGWLQNRARTKPRGYAGDYELLNCIYERRTSDEALGRLFDRYFQNQAAPQAVRNRMSMMTGWIAEALHSRIVSHQNRLLKVAFMGSALGLEIRDACLQLDANLRKQLHAVLVDMDPDALDYAKQQGRKGQAKAKLKDYPMHLFR
jgi:hypothetical protein